MTGNDFGIVAKGDDVVDFRSFGGLAEETPQVSLPPSLPPSLTFALSYILFFVQLSLRNRHGLHAWYLPPSLSLSLARALSLSLSLPLSLSRALFLSVVQGTLLILIMAGAGVRSS